jgi:O-antigen ligase
LARHAKAVDRRARATRLSILTVIWLSGLAAGFFGLLAAVARYGCGANDNGLACRGSGSIVGILIVIAVVGVVTAVTVMTHDRMPRRVIAIGCVGLGAVMVCFIAARSLLGTV